MSEKKVSLSVTEIEHVLYLIKDNERDGWHFSPKEQYFKRSERIKVKLHKALEN